MSKVLVVVSAASLCIAMVGCSSDSSSSSSGGSGSTGGSSGSSGSTGQSLYEKYGGDAGVYDVTVTAVNGVLADPNEAPYFADVVANASNTSSSGQGPNGADNPTRLTSCLQYQLALALGAPGGLAAFPPPSADPRGYHCVDMQTAHGDLGIPNGTFDIFVLDAAGVLAAKGVSADDVQTIGGVLNSLRGQIVSTTPRYYYCADAGLVDGANVPADFDGGCLN